MKYTRPTVATATTQSIDPRVKCEADYTCGKDGNKFTCSHFRCSKDFLCGKYN
jgi:hypothetical protein